MSKIEKETPCCKKLFDVADWPVKYNRFNCTIQCHHCGHIYEPADYALKLCKLLEITHEQD